MKKHIRFIPRMDLKNDRLIKSVQLEGLRVIGNQEFFAEKYYKDGADELIYQDVVASLYGTNTLENVIKLLHKTQYVYTKWIILLYLSYKNISKYYFAGYSNGQVKNKMNNHL